MMKVKFGLIAGILCAVVPCRAQETHPVTFQANTDFRARTGAGSGAALYGSDFNVKAHLNRGFSFRYDGAQSNAPILTGFGGRFNRFITQEAVLEKNIGTQRFEAGIVRLPFGLYDHGETYASGLIDYPLVRGDYALNGLDWGVPGVRFSGGAANLQGQLAIFGGQSAGIWGNLNNASGAAFRLQTYSKGLIVGLSRWDGTLSASFEHPGSLQTHITGLDMRFTRPHFLLRGEYLTGELSGEQTRGWYLDFNYHLPKFEKWTLVTRIEEYQAESDSRTARQITTGVRYTLNSQWILAVNWRSNNGVTYSLPNWTPPSARAGDVFFQVYRKFNF